MTTLLHPLPRSLYCRDPRLEAQKMWYHQSQHLRATNHLRHHWMDTKFYIPNCSLIFVWASVFVGKKSHPNRLSKPVIFVESNTPMGFYREQVELESHQSSHKRKIPNDVSYPKIPVMIPSQTHKTDQRTKQNWWTGHSEQSLKFINYSIQSQILTARRWSGRCECVFCHILSHLKYCQRC